MGEMLWILSSLSLVTQSFDLKNKTFFKAVFFQPLKNKIIEFIVFYFFLINLKSINQVFEDMCPKK